METLTDIHGYVAGSNPAESSKSVVERLVKLPSALTAENGAKALLIGEFFETTEIECPACNGDDRHAPCDECGDTGTIWQRVPVEWDTIKRIYDKIVEHFSI